MAGGEPELMAMLEPLLAVLASMRRARPADETHSRRCQAREDLHAVDDLALHRPDSCADLSGNNRPAGTLRAFARYRCASRPAKDVAAFIRRLGTDAKRRAYLTPIKAFSKDLGKDVQIKLD
jgi:hypothetical protein